MSISDQIIKGTYNKGISNSTSSSSISNSIINGTYSDNLKKKREEEEEKRKAKQESEEKVSNNASSIEDLQKEYDKLSLTEQAKLAKQAQETENSKLSLEKLAESSNSFNNTPLYSGETLKEKYGELTKITLSDIDASERADEINKAIEDNDYGTAIGFIVEGLGEGVKSGFAGIANAGLSLEAYNMESGEKNIGKLIDAYEKMLNNNGLLNSEKGQKILTNLEKIRDFFGNSKEKLLDNAEYLGETTNKYQKTLAKVDNNIVKTGGQVTNTIGEMLPSIASNFVLPGSGAIVTGVQEAGHSAIENLDNERGNLGKSVLTGTLKGTVAGTVEKFTGGDFISEGFVDKWAVKGISKLTANKVAQNVLWKVYQVAGEQVEELLEDDIGSIIDKVINGEEFPTIQEKLSQAGETAKVTGLTTLVLNAIGLGGGSFSDAVTRTQQTLPTVNNQNTQTSQQNTTPLANTIEQNNVDTNIENNQEISKILNNKELPMQSYQYEVSSNTKINNLRQDANKYFNNSKEAKNYVNMLEKIITDKNVEIRLDANLKTVDGRIANGSYSNGVITINPNSIRTGEFIAIHELTHAIGTKSMMNIVDNYRKSNSEFDSAVKSLLQNYNTTELTEEALSDVSAQLFGNQEFINSIANTNPGFFQKIYNEIKYLWHQFRGYKNQNQFIEDLYYKWTQAYNSNSKLNETSNYSIAGINAKNASRSKLNKAIELEKQGKTNQEIYEKSGWYRGNESKWRFEISDYDSNIILEDNKYTAINKEYLLPEILNFKELYDAYPGLKNVRVKFVEGKEYSGQFDEKNIYIDINEYNDSETRKYIENSLKMLNSKNANILYSENEILKQKNKLEKKLEEYDEKNNNKRLKSILLHEIQHYIQKEEGFSRGNNESLAKASKEKFISNFKDKINNLKILYNTIGINETMTEEQISVIENNSQYAEEIKELKEDLSKDYELYLKIKDMTPFEIYENTAGEQEAVDVQNRMDLTAEERKVILPFVKNKNMIYNTNEGIINGGDKNALQERKRHNFSVNEQFRGEKDNSRGNKQNNISYSEQRGKSNTESNTRNGTNGKGQEYDKIKNLGNDKDIIISQASANNSGSLSKFANLRYSKNNKSWQQYLDKNFKQTGTRTNLKDIGINTAPAAKDNVAPSEANNTLATGEYTKQQNEVKEQKKVAEVLDKPIGKVSEKNRTAAILKANLIDKGIVFEELSRKTDNRELQGKWDYTLTAEARGQNAIGQARYEMDADTKTEKQISKSLEDIRIEVGDKTSDFQNYMYHQLNIDRMTLEERFSGDTGINYERKESIKNKPVFGKSVTADISKKIVAEYEQKNPEFKNWAKDVYDFLDANKKELVDRGVISQELSDKLSEMYPHYVPIKRVDAKGLAIKVPLDTNRTGINSPLAKATGGSSDIQPLFQTIADRTLQTYKASARNNFGVELMNTLNSVQETSNVDIDTILEEIGDENTELLHEGKNGNSPTFTVFENGEKKTFEITKDMYDALKPQSEWINQLNNNKVAKFLNKVSNFRRGVLTEYNPIFSLTNPIKDFQDAVMNSEHPAKTYAKFGEAYAQIIKKGYWYNEYIQNGGKQNSYFKDGEFTSDKKNSKLKTAIKIPFETISKVNNVIEMAPRLAEYIASRENGRSIEVSMLDAARVTTNFKAGGDFTKTLNRNGFTFLNASVQGFQQQVRNIQDAHAKGLKGYAVLATKYAIAGLPTLLLNSIIWKDDEDYDELQDYVKDNYYCIAKYGDGKFVRIPKGRVAATIQKIVSNVTEYITDDKELNIDNIAKDFWEDLKFTVDNVAPNNPADNNVLSPIVQTVTNTSWYGEDIVPSRLQNKPKAEQYDETTDSLSIWLGEKLNQSPYKINYLLDQYGGGVSDVILPKLTKQAENNVFEDKFTTDSTMKNRYPGEFYTKLDELTVNANSDKATDEDIIKYKYASTISSEISELYNEKREIQNSNLSDKTKKEKLKLVQEKINKITKESLNNIASLKISGNTATIGDIQFYKDGTAQWNKVSEEEQQKNKNISLKTYADYKNKTESMKKDSEKINVIINGNYTNKEKTALYENYILSATDEKYSIIKETGIDINEYLKYKLAEANGEFGADRKDDGTVKGEAIRGSAKQKRKEYIENMSVTYTQAAILYGLECTPSDNNKKQIVNYIKTMPNKTNTERLEMLKQFEWITVYKDGTIEY